MSHQSGKKMQAPAVVSTGCGSGLMSCLSVRRRAPTPPMPTRRRGDEDDDAAPEQCSYWERLHLLEEEIRRLGRMSSNGKADQVSTGTAMTIKRCVSAVQKMTKLEDGSYLHEICRRHMGRRPWERLAVQVSKPVVSATAATASEVLDKLVTMGKAEETCRFLAKTMPMKDIAGQWHKQKDTGETVHRRTASVSSAGSDFMEAVLFSAMDRMEGLILDGLKIQMSSSSAPSNATVNRKRNNEDEEHSSMVVPMVLVQVRDPEEGYGAIGDPMIGLLEVGMERKENGRVKVEVRGLHVAGIVGSASWSGSRGGSGLMWSASWVERDNDGRRCSYVRNPDRVFRC